MLLVHVFGRALRFLWFIYLCEKLVQIWFVILRCSELNFLFQLLGFRWYSSLSTAIALGSSRLFWCRRSLITFCNFRMVKCMITNLLTFLLRKQKFWLLLRSRRFRSVSTIFRRAICKRRKALILAMNRTWCASLALFHKWYSLLMYRGCRWCRGVEC